MTVTRGRPRSALVDASILDAALEEYAEHGFDRMSVDGVAARAGVGKAAIYRRYGSKLEVVSAAMFDSGQHTPYPDTGTLDGDVRALLDHLHDLVNHPVLGRCLRHMAADAIAAPDLGAVHEEFVKGRRAGTRAVLQRALDRGELAAGVDLELAHEVLAAPIFYRHLMSHQPVDRPYLDRLRRNFLDSFAA